VGNGDEEGGIHDGSRDCRRGGKGRSARPAVVAGLIAVGLGCGYLWEIPKADVPMAKDADPGWDVVTVKVRDPSLPSNSQSTGMKGS
jgi:hypothetical protein